MAETRGIKPSTELTKLLQPLKDACDRDWKDETPEQIVAIAANAIYWRGQKSAAGEPSRGAPDAHDSDTCWDDLCSHPDCKTAVYSVTRIEKLTAERTALLEALKRLTARLEIVMAWPDKHFSEELPIEIDRELREAEAAIRKAEG